MTVIGSVQDYGRREKRPPECVYVGMAGNAARAYGINDDQAGPFGKPWRLVDDPRGWPVAYAEYLCQRLMRDEKFAQAVKSLAGRTLLCWCSKKERDRGQRVLCHAYILAEFVDMLNQG